MHETIYEAMLEPAFVLAFLGWSTVINVVLLSTMTAMLVASGGFVRRIHGSLFSLSDETLNTVYFKYLAYYKLGIFLFNLTPYLALRIVAG